MVIFFDRRAKYGGEEMQVFFNGQVLVKRKFTRHIPYRAAYLPEILHDIVPVDCRRAAIRQQQRSQHPENAGFAGPVGPYQPKKLAFVYRKRYIVHGHGFFLAVSFDQIFDHNRFHHFNATSPYIPIFK
jgi:hypothetical protein